MTKHISANLEQINVNKTVIKSPETIEMKKGQT